MRRSRMSMLVLVAIAAMVSALPAAASADEFWQVGGKKLGGAGAKMPFLTKGKGTFQVAGLTIGPCDVLDKDVLWNGATMGEGERTIWGLELPCPTNIPDCKVVEANPKGLPWPVTLVANGKVEVTASIDFTFQNTAGCKGANLGGATKNMKGIIPGTFNNSTSCVDSESESGLSFEGLSVLYSGEDCYEVEEGEEGEGEPLTWFEE